MLFWKKKEAKKTAAVVVKAKKPVPVPEEKQVTTEEYSRAEVGLTG